MKVRVATIADRPQLAAMRHALLPEEAPDEIDAVLADPDSLVLIAEQDGCPLGFAEVGIRSYAEGCPGPAAYLEGIWTDESSRRRGVARALLEEAEQWARERGFSHFGSDALIDNHVSHAWHEAAGFAEVERLVVFAKRID